ncbi:MAG TPA: potassium channel family protein, partial [Acidobacteriaceae bacterium]|nr:potassium channel family protein [Acidobacteriaceae bacterium]
WSIDSAIDSCSAGEVHPLRLILGIACLVSALLDAFETVILPRRATGRFRLTKVFYVVTWRPWRWMSRQIRHPRKRETMLSFYGPLSLVVLIAMWAAALLLGFALIYSSEPNPFIDPRASTHSFVTDLYASGTTLFTLGLGDVVPHTLLVRCLAVLEAGMGLGFVALVIGYFPVLYGAFSRREVNIALLDARAGSPPTAFELIKRHSFEGGGAALVLLLEEWERWSAELLESHISYPLLCLFRSQHTSQSWLSALTAILDTCALLIAGVQEQSARQAQLTFAMARHALVDLSQILSAEPMLNPADRLPAEKYAQIYDKLCEMGVRVCRDQQSAARLRELRELYEGYAEALSRYLEMPLPPFFIEHPKKDNWLTVARVRAEAEAGIQAASPALLHDEDHLF